MAVQPDLTRLKSQLATAKVKETDFALFQVINQLIDRLAQSQGATLGEITIISTSITDVKNLDLLTSSNESIELPNSRQLKAGTGITFNDAVANERTVNSTGNTTATYLTEINEVANLPNSRRLIAGANITFNVSVANQLEINTSGGVGGDWSVLTNGSLVTPELIFAGGDVVMLHTP